MQKKTPHINRQLKNTLIRCPSCNTKFAVSKRKLSSTLFPRFHCSKCDNVFGHVGETFEDKDLEREALQKVVGSPVFSINDSIINSAQNDDGDFKPPVTNPENDLLTPPRRVIEIPTQVDAASISAPHETIDSEEDSDEGFQRVTPKHLEPNIDPIDKKIDNKPVDQIKFDFTKGFNELTEPEPIIREQIKRDPGEILPSISLNADALKARGLLGDPNIKSREQGPRVTSSLLDLPENIKKLKKRGNTPSGPWGNVVLLTAPLIGCFLLLTVFSIYLSNDVDSSISLTKSLFPSAPQVAPTGLSIKDNTFTKEILDSGDSVYVISGKLLNSTSNAFDEIIIEGVVFSPQGKAFQTIRTNASSTLAGTKIQSLNLDMIEKIQAEEQGERIRLKPGESRAFAIAFTKNFEEAPAFFSARIYSVKY